MSNLIFLALLSPALWAASNHVDKYILSKYFKNVAVGSQVIFTGLIGLLAGIIILLIYQNVWVLGLSNSILVAFTGALLVAAYIPYIYAINNDEASTVATLYQMIPVFLFILAYIFRGESLTASQMTGSLLVVLGAIGISLDLTKQGLNIKSKTLLLMSLSSLMIATNFLIFKIVALKTSYWASSFWEYMGAGLFAVLLLVFAGSYRRQFFSVIRSNAKAVLSVNVLGEAMNVGAKLVATFVGMTLPLAIVSVLNGFQPVFLFAYGVIITLFLPKLGKENLSSKQVVQKVLAIAIIFIGTFVLFK